MAPTAPSVAHLIFLNRNAVTLVAQGKTLAALKLFQSALNATTENVRQRQEDSTLSTFDVQTVEIGADLRDEQSSPHNSFCIYNHALLLSESVTNADEAAMVLLYNFALTLQIQGLAVGKSQLLRRALKVYTVLERMVNLQMVQATPSFNLLLLALTMNQGHIYSHFVRSMHAEKCRDRIVDLLDCSFDLPLDVLLFFHQAVHHVDFYCAPAA